MSDTNERSVASDGSVGEPVAWGIAWSHDNLDCEHVYESRDNAKAVADDDNGSIVPLYRKPQPRLTDVEREAVAHGAGALIASFLETGSECDREASRVLRGLLERMK